MKCRVPLLLLALITLSFPALAQDVAYTVEVTGIEDADLAEAVEQASRLVSLADRPPASTAALQRRADDDGDRIREVLRAEGYYDGDSTITMDRTAQPVRVAIAVTPGPAYRLTSFSVRLTPPPGSPPPEPITPEALGVELGERARSTVVVAAQAALLRILAEQGRPLAKVDDRRVVVDHATGEMRVEMDVATGPHARFGPVTVAGLRHLDETWVLNRIPWREGDYFDLAALETLRRRLMTSGLFGSTKLTTAGQAGADDRLPLTIEVTERDLRSVGIGANWSSAEGFGGETFWEHRNYFGGAEHLRLSLAASEIRNAAEASWRDPDWGRRDQDLVTAATLEEQRTAAYSTRTAGVRAGLEWLLSEQWRAAAGGAVERTYEEEKLRLRQFTLVSIPLQVRRDSSDDLLDPTRGNRMLLTAQPFAEALGSTVGFTRAELSDTQYLQLLATPRLILAGWGRLGTILGAKAADIPADKRFYIGGGGSVRGYGFQLAGPVDAAGDPIGGRSELAFGGEIRARVTETIGLVPFVEAGSTYQQTWPDLDQRLFRAAGLGLRYHTAVGPVRADIAFPLDRRDGVDAPFQVYFSFGQAF
jgi:translocation and assembly module TamA